MSDENDFFVRFWGVRGSIATPGPETKKYGGNTACLEVCCGGKLLLFDAGTGLRYLGQQLVKDGPMDTDVYLTHTHFDHVCGLPFFVPFFIKGNKFRIWAGHLKPKGLTVRHVVSEMMCSPLFPVPPAIFAADIDYNDFDAGTTMEPHPGVFVRTAPLNHPDNATGHRIEYNDKSICYLTDTQHFPGQPDQNILGLIDGADLVVYDATYTDEEFIARSDWGHSTWEEGVRLCDASGVKTFVVFHHDLDHTDEFMDGISAAVAEKRPGSVVAKEGMVVRP